jgi:predicted nucleic acid-binding protein
MNAAANVKVIDTSVVLAASLDGSTAAARFIEACTAAGFTVAASRFMPLEATHVVKNLGVEVSDLDQYFSHVSLWLSVDNALMAEATDLQGPVRGGDAIHVAAALRIASPLVEFLTHDRQQAVAAQAEGLSVSDPVSDDPSGRLAANPAGPPGQI